MNGWYSRAERQYGAISRAQLRECELTNRQIDALLSRGRLERVHAGVFRVAGSYRSARQNAMAALLWCGDDAVLSHATAASLFRLPLPAKDGIHITVPPSVRRFDDSIKVHRSEFRPDRYMVDGLACTSPVRTIVDVAPLCDGETLEHIFDTARRWGLVTAPVFRRRVEALLTRGRPGTAQLRDLLRVIDLRPKESKLEVRTARLLRRAGITTDATQHRVGDYRIDFVLSLKSKRGLECDGFDWHGNRLAWKRDRRRIGWLEAQGWRLTHVT